MKRRLLKLPLFLLLGAVVNVAVAWGCVHRSLTAEGFFAGSIKAKAVSGNDHLWLAAQCSDAEKLGAMATVYTNIGYHRIVYGDHSNEKFGERICAGWPCFGVGYAQIKERRSWRILDGVLIARSFRGNPGRGVEIMPLRPIWPGFAINTLFYAALLWGGWLLFAAAFALRRRLRLKRGLCPACAYPIGESSVCTECGKAIPLSLRERDRVRAGATL